VIFFSAAIYRRTLFFFHSEQMNQTTVTPTDSGR
jgi:hypothetical protein